MRTIDVRRYTMLVRVKEFGSTHADLFPPGSAGASTLAALGSLLDQLDGHVVSQASGRSDAQKGGLTKAAARAALHDAIEAIVNTARGMAVADPEVGKTFPRLPDQKDQTLATTAKAFAEKAAPLSATFVARGLPSTFIADLGNRLEAFSAATKAHGTAKQSHIKARADIRTTLAAAMATLRQLEPIVENVIGADSGLLAAWQSARHVEQAGRGSTKPAPPATSSSAPGPKLPAPAAGQPAAPASVAAVKAA